MVRIESFQLLHEAQMLVNELEAEGIAARVRSDLTGATGIVPFTQTYCEVWIERAEDEPRALEILASMRERSDAVPSEEPEAPAPVQKASRVRVAGRSNFIRALWLAGAVLPGTVLYLQGSEVAGVFGGVVLAGMLWALSGVKRNDYCSNCRISLEGNPDRCEDCRRRFQKDLPEAEYVKGGGTPPAPGMAGFVSVITAIVLVLFACFMALSSGGESKGSGWRRVYPQRTKPF